MTATKSERSTATILASREQALQAARALHASLASRTAHAEELRSVPSETIEELRDVGLFGLMTPRRWGGSELGYAAVLEVQAELASACVSTGWVYGVLTGHSWLAALFPERAQADVFQDDPQALIASLLRLSGEAPAKVDGGFRWQGGTGRFCSGIDHSAWVLLGGTVTDGDAGPEAWYFLIPREDVEIVDDWHAVGLKGTGSKSILVKDAFIPDYRAVKFADLSAGRGPGAALHHTWTYHLPYDSIWPLTLSGAALGGARGALEAFTRATASRLAKLPPIAQASNGTALRRLATAAAQIEASFALLLADATAADTAPAGSTIGDLEKARRQRNLAYAVQQCRLAVNDLYEGSGGSGVYLGGEMQRWWRDVNAAAQHIAFAWDLSSVGYGRAAVGLSSGPAVPAIKR